MHVNYNRLREAEKNGFFSSPATKRGGGGGKGLAIKKTFFLNTVLFNFFIFCSQSKIKHIY